MIKDYDPRPRLSPPRATIPCARNVQTASASIRTWRERRKKSISLRTVQL
jgi:hypothetical protein